MKAFFGNPVPVSLSLHFFDNWTPILFHLFPISIGLNLCHNKTHSESYCLLHSILKNVFPDSDYPNWLLWDDWQVTVSFYVSLFPVLQNVKPGILPKPSNPHEYNLGDIMLGMRFIEKDCNEQEKRMQEYLPVRNKAVWKWNRKLMEAKNTLFTSFQTCLNPNAN